MSGTLYELFAATAERAPEAPAVELPGRTLTYRELGRAADALARRVTALRPAAARVGLAATRSAVAFAGYLAALRLGAAVVPLNPEHPDERLARVVEQAAVDVVVTDAAAPAGHTWASGLPVLTVTDEDVLTDDGTRTGPRGALPPYRPDPDATAYVLFTSGTTGRPKGMPLRHRHVLPFVRECLTRYEVGPGCRMSHTFDLTFDPSLYDLFVTWAGGAVLVVPGRAEMFSPVDYAVGRALTHWFSVPSAVSVSAQLGTLPTGRSPSEALTTLRYSIFGGEQFTLGQARLWHALAPGSRIDNAYGPSETAIACAAHRLPRDPAHWPRTSNGTVPIGRVFDHLESRLDEETGELRVRGPQRFDGYADPRDDAGRFLGLPDGERPGPEHFFRTGDRVGVEDGLLVHLGRLDDQVKIRGLRVEPGDVEASMRRLPQVHDAVVTAVRRDGVAELVACYTGEAAPARDLVRALRAGLPVHLVPRRFVHLAELPLGANGKTDRQALRALADRAAHDPSDHPKQ
ncbi:AMP-binding protein [Streptomyces sp. NPDC050703]|uniref:AMP-binding protein n=1 Tax=Streptomyces sp. NPDC050703 TaxID=3157218 RepID=UPI00343B6BCE